MKKKCIKCGHVRTGFETIPEFECPNCGVIYAKAEAAAAQKLSRSLGSETRVSRFPDSSQSDFTKSLVFINKDRSQINTPASKFSRACALLGCMLLIAGVFAPIISAPIIGNINYFRSGRGDGVIILIIAAASVFFLFTNQFRKLYWTGGAALTMLLFTAGRLAWVMNDAKSSMDKELKGNPFRGIADAFALSVQIEWGWAVLVMGSLLIMLSAFSYTKKIKSFNELFSIFNSESNREEAKSGIGQSAGAKESNRISDLVKLTELKRSGAITETEFNKLKGELINK